jgi:hypothetical protein
MFSKKFSIETAYTQGARIVLHHFMFFVLAMAVGALIIGAVLVVLGYLEIEMLKHHFGTLTQMFQHVASTPTGALHYGGTSLYESVSQYSPYAAQQFIGQTRLSTDIRGQDIQYLIKILVPAMLVMKLAIDMITTGWTKIALSYSANQTVSLNYLYSYYYLVPRVFVVNLIVGILTLLGTMMFVFPGIFVFQRLRFARYFIIDKNLSIDKALQASWAMTDGAVLQLIGFSIVHVIVKALGGLLVLTALFTIPLSLQAEANVYKQMTQ